MSGWQLTLSRNWNQAAERQPVTESRLVEYDEPDDDGFVAELQMSVQIGAGSYLTKSHKMDRSQFRFFVDAIADRYHAGGPK